MCTWEGGGTLFPRGAPPLVTPCYLLLSLVLQDYAGYHKVWGSVSPPVKLLCPIDRSKEGSGSVNDSEAEEGSGAEGGGGGGESGPRGGGCAQSMNLKGRRMLLCNIDGIYYQVCSLYVCEDSVYVCADGV